LFLFLDGQEVLRALARIVIVLMVLHEILFSNLSY
jgi:hypothetical protein